MRRFSISLVFLALLLRPVPASAQAFVVADEASVHQMVNATRTGHGLTTLIRSGALDQVARAQSERMLREQDLFHNPNLAADITGLGLEWLWTGENVGVGPNVVAIHEAFVASLHHYENIIRANYDHIGVGVVSNPAGGVYVTQVFAQFRASPATAAPPPQVAVAPPPTPRPPAVPTAPPEAPTAAPAPAPPAPIAIEGGIVKPGAPFLAVVDEHPGVFEPVTALFRSLLGR